MSKLKIALLAITLIGFTSLGIHDVTSKRNELHLQNIELESKESKLLELQVDYKKVNKQLKEQLTTDEVKEKELEKLRKERKQLESQLEGARADLQAKRDRQSAEQQRLATAHDNALRTQTASASGGCEQYRPLVAKYNWDVDTMMRIMNAESGCSPTNHNFGDTHKDANGNVICYGSWGLFNIGCVHGYSMQAMENPEANVKAAYQVWNGGNYGAWTTY